MKNQFDYNAAIIGSGLDDVMIQFWKQNEEEYM